MARGRARCGCGWGCTPATRSRSRTTSSGSTCTWRARIAATAHGGQVVLSRATADRARDRLPPTGRRWSTSATHRLKDIEEPQRLYQLVGPRAAAPRSRRCAASAPRAACPSPPTPLVGRDAETVGARRRCCRRTGTRLVTLTGPGGTGKTRLVARGRPASVAADLPRRRPLRRARRGDRARRSRGPRSPRRSAAPATTRRGLARAPARPRSCSSCSTTSSSCRGSGAPVVSRLLGGDRRRCACSRPAGGRCTSPGSRSTPCRRSAFRQPGRPAPTVEAAAAPESVRLFVQQARLADPAFALTDDNVADVVALCRPPRRSPARGRARRRPGAAAATARPARPPRRGAGAAARRATPSGSRPCGRPSTGATGWSATPSSVPSGRSRRSARRAARSTPSPPSSACRRSLAVVSGLLDASLVRVDDDPGGAACGCCRRSAPSRTTSRPASGELDDLPASARASTTWPSRSATSDRLRGPDAMAARGALELEMDNLRAALDWSLGGSRRARAPTDEDRTAIGIRLCTALGLVLVPHRLRHGEPAVAGAGDPGAARQQGPAARPAAAHLRAPAPAAR